MVKLRVFQLFEYHRIIFLDSDMMVRRNLDHLFFLPETSHIAGPRVYFQHFDGRPNFFCSCLMVLTPNQHMWERIIGNFDEDGYVREREMYDMDLLNKEFVDEATILPGIYELLTAHLESERCLKELRFMDSLECRIRRGRKSTMLPVLCILLDRNQQLIAHWMP